MVNRALWDSLGGDLLPANEFTAVIAGKCASAAMTAADTVTYGTDEGPALLLQYEGFKLIGIERGPALSEALVDSVLTAVNHEASITGEDVLREFLFAEVPVEGWWRYSDRFQLLPAPPEAPRPNQLIADHPFVLEYRSRRADDVGVAVARRSTAEQRVRLLLGALTWFQITGRGWRGSRNSWVLVLPNDGAPLPEGRVVCAQSYYGVEGFQAVADDLSDIAGAPRLVEEPDDVHYGRRGISIGETLAVPASLVTLLDRFYALDPDAQAKFLRSCYWLVHANEVRELSSSAALSSLVQAVEALTPDTSGGPRCPQCNKPTTGAFKGFEAFVERYAPAVDKRARRALYGPARSAILHGDRLLPHDFAPLSFGPILPEVADAWQLFDIARSASKAAVVNWLLDESRK